MMTIGFLAGGCLITFVLAFVWMIIRQEGHHDRALIRNCHDYCVYSVLGLVFLSFVAILISVQFVPYEIDSNIECKIQVSESGVQYVEHDDDSAHFFVNLNEMFDRTFQDEEKVEIVVYSEGPYLYGLVSFVPKWEVSAKTKDGRVKIGLVPAHR